MSSLHHLSQDLPKPENDGACDHLPGLHLPDLRLPASNGQYINLSLFCGLTVIYIYPMTAQPGEVLPESWDSIPGARGCTPQSCAYRDHYDDFRKLGCRVFGLSTQHTDTQQEAVNRLHLPFSLLSDHELLFSRALQLPCFQFEHKTLLKRVTLFCENGVIEKVFYPVFPADRNAETVIAYLKKRDI